VKTDNNLAGLLRSLERRMFETVWRVLRHSQDAEDALQNALTTIWRERPRIERHPVPQALILKICADAAIDQFRRGQRQRIECDVGLLGDRLPTARLSPMEDAIQRERVELIMRAISQLSQNQATALVMRFFQMESDKTIAAAMDCGIETVREHLARGKERLSHMLRPLSPRI
jgi:RNA polymerase sigma-70 factor (ECF subfamily)